MRRRKRRGCAQRQRQRRPRQQHLRSSRRSQRHQLPRRQQVPRHRPHLRRQDQRRLCLRLRQPRLRLRRLPPPRQLPHQQQHPRLLLRRNLLRARRQPARLRLLLFVLKHRLRALRLPRHLRPRVPPALRHNGRRLEVQHSVRGNPPLCARQQPLPGQPDPHLQRVRPCLRAAIADRYPTRPQDRAKVARVRVNRCARCLQDKAAGHIRHDQADPPDSQDLLNSDEGRCLRARAQGPARPDVPGCCRLCRPTRRRQRPNQANRYIRGNLHSGSGLRWTSERLRVSANCTRRDSVRERGARWRR